MVFGAAAQTSAVNNGAQQTPASFSSPANNSSSVILWQWVVMLPKLWIVLRSLGRLFLGRQPLAPTEQRRRRNQKAERANAKFAFNKAIASFEHLVLNGCRRVVCTATEECSVTRLLFAISLHGAQAMLLCTGLGFVPTLYTDELNQAHPGSSKQAHSEPDMHPLYRLMYHIDNFDTLHSTRYANAPYGLSAQSLQLCMGDVAKNRSKMYVHINVKLLQVNPEALQAARLYGWIPDWNPLKHPVYYNSALVWHLCKEHCHDICTLIISKLDLVITVKSYCNAPYALSAASKLGAKLFPLGKEGNGVDNTVEDIPGTNEAAFHRVGMRKTPAAGIQQNASASQLGTRDAYSARSSVVDALFDSEWMEQVGRQMVAECGGVTIMYILTEDTCDVLSPGGDKWMVQRIEHWAGPVDVKRAATSAAFGADRQLAVNVDSRFDPQDGGQNSAPRLRDKSKRANTVHLLEGTADRGGRGPFEVFSGREKHRDSHRVQCTDGCGGSWTAAEHGGPNEPNEPNDHQRDQYADRVSLIQTQRQQQEQADICAATPELLTRLGCT
ncbi:hypothetical protein EDC05_003236 [Coemansia umbellata]|nr:hypothetical protein EDC05_003236 [Coemansia umbellata]